MYVSEIFASGFRCFGPDNPLLLRLSKGLNILVGPNDSGKTAVIDAPRLVLWTRGDDFVRLDPSDFHVKPDSTRSQELLVRCTFDALTPDEESRFMEWCSNEGGTLRLHVCLRATLRKLAGGGYTAVSQYRSGKNGDGLPLEGDLREYLKSTYLRPLRDAERELRPGRRSRLSRILGALPSMESQAAVAQPGATATLKDVMQKADNDVEANPAVQAVQGSVNTSYLTDLSFSGDPLRATLGLGAKGSFEHILERLELYLNSPPGQNERVARGLGYNNLLFMAAELLLLQSHPDQVPFLLIEEPEAHLHPQHQTLFMQLLEQRAAEAKSGESSQQVQVLLTTHSPQLAASADLNAMVMMVNQRAFPLGKGHTNLKEADYAFLRRFLDATKANLFFARGVVIVEGDAENILLPAIARKMGRSFAKHGVSIVNVGHRGLFRYSRIMQRAGKEPLPIPVALVPDRDVPPDAARALIGPDRDVESNLNVEEKKALMETLRQDEGGNVSAFPSEQWPLEFDLARQPGLALLMYKAIQIAKGRGQKTAEVIASEVASELAAMRQPGDKSADDIAVEIFAPLHKKQVSKAMVAERLAALIDALPDSAESFTAKLPAYLVRAINHVTGGEANAAQTKGSPSVARAAQQ